MTIHVTREHIRDGKKADCRCCPIALALEPFVTKQDDFYVNRLDVVIAPWRFRLPKVARNFIRRFDNDMGPKPFSFSMSAENFICAK